MQNSPRLKNNRVQKRQPNLLTCACITLLAVAAACPVTAAALTHRKAGAAAALHTERPRRTAAVAAYLRLRAALRLVPLKALVPHRAAAAPAGLLRRAALLQPFLTGQTRLLGATARLTAGLTAVAAVAAVEAGLAAQAGADRAAWRLQREHLHPAAPHSAGACYALQLIAIGGGRGPGGWGGRGLGLGGEVVGDGVWGRRRVECDALLEAGAYPGGCAAAGWGEGWGAEVGGQRVEQGALLEAVHHHHHNYIMP